MTVHKENGDKQGGSLCVPLGIMLLKLRICTCSIN